MWDHRRQATVVVEMGGGENSGFFPSENVGREQLSWSWKSPLLVEKEDQRNAAKCGWVSSYVKTKKSDLQEVQWQFCEFWALSLRAENDTSTCAYIDIYFLYLGKTNVWHSLLFSVKTNQNSTINLCSHNLITFDHQTQIIWHKNSDDYNSKGAALLNRCWQVSITAQWNFITGIELWEQICTKSGEKKNKIKHRSQRIMLQQTGKSQIKLTLDTKCVTFPKLI